MSEGHLETAALERFDDLCGIEREAVLGHVSGCAACRSRLVAADPSRLFALLAADPVPAAALERLSARVGAAIDGERPPARGPAWASLAASLLLAASIGGYLLRAPGAPGGPPAAAPVELAAEEGPTSGGIELLSPADAEVWDLSVGEAQIVMIFDERIDI